MNLAINFVDQQTIFFSAIGSSVRRYCLAIVALVYDSQYASSLAYL